MRLEIDIPEHHYNNIMALDSVSLGRVPYKGIIMYTINAIKHGRVLEQEPRWIPVSERLPEPNRLVLCYITTGATKTYFLALRNEYYDDWEEGIGGSRLLGKDLGYKVIAWMPLPKPYEPQESEGRE